MNTKTACPKSHFHSLDGQFAGLYLREGIKLFQFEG
jgi:hypothetical protein